MPIIPGSYRGRGASLQPATTTPGAPRAGLVDPRVPVFGYFSGPGYTFVRKNRDTIRIPKARLTPAEQKQNFEPS